MYARQNIYKHKVERLWFVGGTFMSSLSLIVPSCAVACSKHDAGNGVEECSGGTSARGVEEAARKSSKRQERILQKKRVNNREPNSSLIRLRAPPSPPDHFTWAYPLGVLPAAAGPGVFRKHHDVCRRRCMTATLRKGSKNGRRNQLVQQ